MYANPSRCAGAFVLLAILSAPTLALAANAPAPTTRPAQPFPLGVVIGPIITGSENILRTPYPPLPPAANSAAVPANVALRKAESEKRTEKINKLVESAIGSFVTVPLLIRDVTATKTPGQYLVTGQFSAQGAVWRSSLSPADQARIADLRAKSRKRLTEIGDAAGRSYEIQQTEQAVENIENARPATEIAFTTSNPKALQWPRGATQSIKGIIRQIEVVAHRGFWRIRFISPSEVTGYSGSYMEMKIILDADAVLRAPSTATAPAPIR